MITLKCVRCIQQFPAFALVLSLVSLISAAPPAHNWVGATPQASECQAGVGGWLFSNGGELEVEILPTYAGFTSELNFVSPGPSRFIATNRDAGWIVKLGAFPAGVELRFSIFVRETQKTFFMGPGSTNPDGLPHAQVTCFGEGRASVGFEDQVGGGDQNYIDLVFAVRQPLNNCTYSLSSTGQSFDASGGRGSVTVTPSSGCSWAAVSNASWIAITSGSSGSDRGTINYTVAPNTDASPRTGALTVQAQPFTINQDGTASLPLITSALASGKKLFVYGINFDSGSVILLNGEQQRTRSNPDNPRTVLIGKKAGKFVKPGDMLRVQSSAGAMSPEYPYTP